MKETSSLSNSSQNDLPRSSPGNRFSLLWPDESRTDKNRRCAKLNPGAWHDLGLDHIAAAFSPDPEHRRVVAEILAVLCQDEAVIIYRQEVLEDFLQHPQLTGRLMDLLPAIDALGRFSYRVVKDMNTLHEVTWRVGELQSIVDCIQGLGSIFREVGENLNSRGLLRLRGIVEQIEGDETFRNLAQELPKILAELRACASVTIGVNLDQFLRPVEATLLSVNDQKFTSQSMLGRLFGKGSGMEGIAPLHSVPRREVEGQYALPIPAELGWAVEPLMVPLFRDLADVIEKITQPVATRLKKYVEIKSRLFTDLRQDLVFYLGGVRLIRRLQALGFPVARPKLAPLEERVCVVERAYNVNLILHLDTPAAGENRNLAALVTLNPIRMGPDGRIIILTGPNQGGKTTYMQGLALAQVLAQVGLYVPGEKANISPVEAIYTHFPLEEKPEANTGRFGEEAKRLGEIFQHMNRYSLVLLNESLSSTSAGESLYLSQDVVRIIRQVGARAIFSTHLHELAEQVDALNADTPGDSLIVSVVSSPIERKQASPDGAIQRSFRIEARPPLGRSYADEIAARYGIGYTQLEKILKDRGVL
jgi:DNA mismatch repair protein MutS